VPPRLKRPKLGRDRLDTGSFPPFEAPEDRGDSGHCYTGPDARKRAVAQYQAALANGYQEKSEEMSRLASEIAGLPEPELDRLIKYLPPLPQAEAWEALKASLEPGSEATAEPQKPQGFPDWVKKADEDLQIVWAEVYVPYVVDADGDFATPEQIREMSYDFVSKGQLGEIDVQHDGKTDRGLQIVETFIARDDDTLFIQGSWVVGIHVPHPETWEAVKKGDLNGFSMEAYLWGDSKTVTVELPPMLEGRTQEGPAPPPGAWGGG